MENIVQLLISMIVAYEEYGDVIGYTKEELDIFVKKYDLLKQDWNELGALVLYEYKYISMEKFAKVMDMEIIDDDFWLVFDDFADILPSDFDFEAKVLDGRMWEDWQPSDYYDYDIDFSNFSEKTLQVIIDYCDKIGCEIGTDDGEILLTKNNMTIKNGNIYVKEENLEEHMDDDGMNDLKRDIQFGIADAYDGAEADAVYNACKSDFVEAYGEYKWVSTKKGEKTIEKLYVKMDKDLSDVRSSLEDDYFYDGKIIYSTEQESFGNMYQVLYEFDFFDMKKPNYDYLDNYPGRDSIDERVRERIQYG